MARYFDFDELEARADTRLVFPGDMGTNDGQTQHWMHIRAFPSGQSYAQQTITLFIPGGPQNSPLVWESVNDYAEVAMTKLGPNVIGIGNFAAQTLAGGAINPKVEVLFRTTNLRNFTFNFLFAPTSLKEANEMEAVIKALRYHAAPELIGGNDPSESYTNTGGSIGQGFGAQLNYGRSGLYMQAPSEFIVDFYYKGQRNTHLPKMARSVITKIDVNYAPQGEFSTFTTGHPVSAMLTVSFTEMRLIDRNNIKDGY